MTIKSVLVLSFIGFSYAISFSESNNEVHITGINGLTHGIISAYSKHHGEEAVLAYHTNDTIACNHLRVNVYRGQQEDPNNLITSLCNDDVKERSMEGFLIVFDADDNVHNGVINVRISAPHGVGLNFFASGK